MAKGDDIGLERLKRIESGGHPSAILAEGMKLRTVLPLIQETDAIASPVKRTPCSGKWSEWCAGLWPVSISPGGCRGHQGSRRPRQLVSSATGWNFAPPLRPAWSMNRMSTGRHRLDTMPAG